MLVRFTKKNGEEKNIVFVDAREGLSVKTILATYDQRSEIEETHRQRRRSIDRNPDIIIYTGETYAILKNLDLIDLILTLKKCTQMKLRKIFKELTS